MRGCVEMKKLIVAALIAVFVVIGIIFALPFLLSSEGMRQDFASKISSVSGMEIKLNGPVNFSVFPDIGLVANDVSLASPEGDFSVSVAKLIAGVKLSTVMSDQVEITGLSLEQPVITIDETVSSEVVESTEDVAEPQEAQSDPFAAAVEQLERLSLRNFLITDGTFISKSKDGNRSVVSDININLEAPSLEREIKADVSAVMDGQVISLSATLAALKSVLERQSTDFSFVLKMDPPSHPALADLNASGAILLAEDGSYQISNGLFSSLGQPLRLDALYRPGKRPYGSLNLLASKVDLGALEKLASPTGEAKTEKQKAPSENSDVDFSALLGFDADFTLQIDRLIFDGITVQALDLSGRLKDGELGFNLGNVTIAEGSVATTLFTNLKTDVPTTRGTLSASSLQISDLARLANIEVPLKGRVGLQISHAFSGFDVNAIRNSLNLAGTVKLTDGSMRIPELKGMGEGAQTLSKLNIEAEITHLQKPVELSGDMVWNGEAIKVDSQITPYRFITSSLGPLSVKIRSKKVDVDFSGDVNLNGTAKGKAKVSTGSLSNLMAWVGQGENKELKKFSYAGNISVDAKKFAFSKAKIVFNDIKASGSGSVGLTGKPNITTDLSFGTLDILALTGGASSGGSTGSAATNSDETPIDLSALKGFDATIKLKAQKIIYDKIIAGPVSGSLVVKNGVAKVKLAKTAFYGGNVSADITANGASAVPALKINAALSQIDTLPFFTAAADFKKLEGRLNGNIELSGAGKTSDQFVKSLKGSTSTKFLDGAIRGIDVAKIYNNLTALLAGGFKENSADKTSFTEMGLSFNIDKGVATTDDIKLLGPLVRMDGAGKIDLGGETIAMRFNPQIVGSLTGQGGEFDVGGVGIPIIVEGPLSQPRVYPDLANILKDPKAALQMISKLGLNIKGLDIGALGDGTKLKPDALIGNLIKQKLPGVEKILPGGADKLIGGLLGNILKPGVASPDDEGGGDTKDDTQSQASSGGIPIPTPSPRRTGTATPKPASVKETIVEKVVPKLNLPIEDDAAKKTLNGLLNGLIPQN